MRFVFFLVALLYSTVHAQRLVNGWKLTPFGSVDKLLASSNAPLSLDKFAALPVQLDAVRGENVSFQFVVSATQTPIQTISVRANGLASITSDFITSEQFQFFRENYVFVAHPSGNRIKEPKWWPDALVPLALAPQTIEPNGSAVFWTTLHIPRDAAPGDYYGELDIEVNGENRRLALTLRVRPLELPASHFKGTLALYYDTLRDWYRNSGREFSDKEWTKQKQRYANFLLDFGLNPYDPPVAWNDASVDDYLKDPRVHSVRTPSLDSPDFQIALEALKRTQTTDKSFYYWNDEPQSKEQFDAIKANSPKLRALHIPQLVTTHPTPELLDFVDIWCPNIANALGSGHLDIAQLKLEQTKNHPTWLYTMVVPKHPYPTWLLDDDSSAVLSFAPLWNRVGASGFVYSMAHGWGPKPLENLQSFQGTNGDGTLIYPAEPVGGTGPMPSIRLMLLRDAIEDLALWNEATKRKIAPAFSFPATRSSALIYNRKPLLDALESGKAAPVKPEAAPQLFVAKPTQTVFKAPFSRALDAKRRVEVAVEKGDLKVRAFGPRLTKNEELVVLLAPFDVEEHTVMSRFSLGFDGKIAASTRANSLSSAVLLQGQPFVLQEKSAFGLVLPFPASPNRVRFNVLLRSPSGTARLFPDGNDPFLMPLLQLR